MPIQPLAPTRRLNAGLWPSPCAPCAVGSARGSDNAPELRPMARAAETVAPRQEAQGEAVQDVLLGEADRAVHLMGDGRALLRRFGASDFGGGRFEKHRLVEGVRLRHRIR